MGQHVSIEISLLCTLQTNGCLLKYVHRVKSGPTRFYRNIFNTYNPEQHISMYVSSGITRADMYLYKYHYRVYSRPTLIYGNIFIRYTHGGHVSAELFRTPNSELTGICRNNFIRCTKDQYVTVDISSSMVYSRR